MPPEIQFGEDGQSLEEQKEVVKPGSFDSAFSSIGDCKQSMKS